MLMATEQILTFCFSCFKSESAPAVTEMDSILMDIHRIVGEVGGIRGQSQRREKSKSEESVMSRFEKNVGAGKK